MTFARRFTLAAAFALLGCLPARAQEIKIGESLVCDTVQQVERFAALYSGNSESAATAVNKEAKNPTACAMATIAYVRGRDVGMVRTHAGFYYRVVQILVIGVVTDDNLESTTPAAFYSVERLAERDA